MLASGFLVVMTSVVALGAVTLAKLPTRAPFVLAATELCMIRLNVQAASRAVSGVPSVHFRLERILKVQLSLSGDTDHEAARYGAGWPFWLIIVSVGYMLPSTSRSASKYARNGLNVENGVSASSRSVELDECGEEAVAA